MLSKFEPKRTMRRWLSTVPAVYLPLRRLRNSQTVVHPATDLLIEGYPRSANTWTEALIREASAHQLALAHHSHAAAHVMVARKLGVPSVVLFRDPDDAVASFLLLHDNMPDARGAFLDYAHFYKAAWPLRCDVVRFYSFEDVTKRADATIADLALAFDLQLSADGVTRESVFDRMDEKAARLLRRHSKQSKSRPDLDPTANCNMRSQVRGAVTSEHAATARAAAYAIYDTMHSDLG